MGHPRPVNPESLHTMSLLQSDNGTGFQINPSSRGLHDIVDLKDAYWHVSIHTYFRKFFGVYNRQSEIQV